MRAIAHPLLYSPRVRAPTEEFYAHSLPVNCVSIGRSSAAVLASGADDQIVNIWRLGKIKPLMVCGGARMGRRGRRESESDKREGSVNAVARSLVSALLSLSPAAARV